MIVPDRFEAHKRWPGRSGSNDETDTRETASQGPDKRGADAQQVGGSGRVLRYEGTDSATGLSVLIYEFDGEPRAWPGLPHSDNLPEVVWSDSSGNRGGLVARPADGFRRIAAGDKPLGANELLDAARAVRDAAEAGLVHGDIRPERLLRTEDRLQIEGYGVPWQTRKGAFTAPEVGSGATEPATEQGDVWSLATAVEVVGTTVDDDTVSAVLELCRSADPTERPSPDELYLALQQLLTRKGAAAEPEAAEPEAAEPEAAEPEAADPEAAERHREQQKEWLPGGGAQKEWRRPERRQGDWRHEQWWKPAPAEGGGVATRSAQEPDADGADGSLVDSRETGRRLAMIGVLLAAVVALALLALYGPRSGRSAIPAREATVYVVEVLTAPEGLPPVTIHLVSSPPGSNLARGDRLGTAPRHLALDKPGTWAFEGSLEDRRSRVVEIEVPEQRSFTLTMPADADGNP